MRLSDEQIAGFEHEGYLLFPDLFDTGEIAALMAEAPGIFAEERTEVVREKDGTTARTAFAAHTYNDAFARLGRHPRLIRPVEQLLGGPVYIYQYRINAKAAFEGDVWQWHQDYGTWARDDEMPAGAG
jgi:ectoine hydroxylase